MAHSELVPRSSASLSPAELADAEALVREAGWNQVAADWAIFRALGTVYAVRDRAGRVVATAATLPYGGRFAWISMVLVAGEYRRRGLAHAADASAASTISPPPAWCRCSTPRRPAARSIAGSALQDSWGFQRLVRRERARADVAVRPAGVAIRAIADADWPALVRLRRRGLRRRAQRNAGADCADGCRRPS